MLSQKRSDRMLNAATQSALRSWMRYRHGAVIVKGGKILSSGYNHVRTGFSGPLSAHQTITLEDTKTNASVGHNQLCFSMHAEMHAITSALKGQRPSVAKSNVLLDPRTVEASSDEDGQDTRGRVKSRSNTTSYSSSDEDIVCSRLGDVVSSTRREQISYALTTQNQSSFKPHFQESWEKPKAKPSFFKLSPLPTQISCF